MQINGINLPFGFSLSAAVSLKKLVPLKLDFFFFKPLSLFLFYITYYMKTCWLKARKGKTEKKGKKTIEMNDPLIGRIHSEKWWIRMFTELLRCRKVTIFSYVCRDLTFFFILYLPFFSDKHRTDSAYDSLYGNSWPCIGKRIISFFL